MLYILLLGTLRTHTCLLAKLRGNTLVLQTIFDCLRPGPTFSQAAYPRIHDLVVVRDTLYQQAQELMNAVETLQNSRIWKALLDPQPCFQVPPPQYTSSGSAEECVGVVKSMISAFAAGPVREVKQLQDTLAARYPTSRKYDLKYMR